MDEETINVEIKRLQTTIRTYVFPSVKENEHSTQNAVSFIKAAIAYCLEEKDNQPFRAYALASVSILCCLLSPFYVKKSQFRLTLNRFTSLLKSNIHPNFLIAVLTSVDGVRLENDNQITVYGRIDLKKLTIMKNRALKLQSNGFEGLDTMPIEVIRELLVSEN